MIAIRTKKRFLLPHCSFIAFSSWISCDSLMNTHAVNKKNQDLTASDKQLGQNVQSWMPEVSSEVHI